MANTHAYVAHGPFHVFKLIRDCLQILESNRGSSLPTSNFFRDS